LAAADPGPHVAGLERLGARGLELLVLLDGGQPEAVLVGEEVARAARPAALDEGRGAEVLQARAGAGQGLAAAARTRRRVHGEAVPDPHAVPAPWAGRDLQRL